MDIVQKEEKQKALESLAKVHFATLTPGNREILKILVNNCFPITYSEKFYKQVPILYKDFARLVLLKTIPVGAIVCRVEEEGNDIEDNENTDNKEKQEKDEKLTKKKKNKKNVDKKEDICGKADSPKKQYFLHLMIILVLENYRRSGIATEIMKFVYNRIKELNLEINKIKLHVLSENTAAIEFYKREGFTILEEIKNHYNIDGVDKDAILMGKELN